VNQDGTDHIHKENGPDTPTKTPQNGQLLIDGTSVVKAIETLTNSVNALVFAICSETELQRVQARAMISK